MEAVTWAITVNIIFVGALLAVFLNAGAWFGPRPAHTGDADLPYETGMRPFAPAYDKMAVLYYKFAVLFVVFDVDLAFLLPWALTRGALSPELMASITAFIALLGLMLVYFWRKGALEC